MEELGTSHETVDLNALDKAVQQLREWEEWDLVEIRQR